MRIGIDIDGVLINTVDVLIKLGMKYAAEHNIKYELHSEEFSTDEIFGWGKENEYKFWQSFYKAYYVDCSPS